MLSEWQAYESLEPFGPLWHDVRAGVIASTIANFNGWCKPDKHIHPWDFFPHLGKPAEKQPDIHRIVARMKAWGEAKTESYKRQKEAEGPSIASPPSQPQDKTSSARRW